MAKYKYIYPYLSQTGLIEVFKVINTFVRDQAALLYRALHPVAKSGNYRDLINTPLNLSEFRNDTKYITMEDLPPIDKVLDGRTHRAISNKAVKTYVDKEFSKITSIEYETVDSLPSSGKAGVIYLLKVSGSKDGKNIYQEYIWLTSQKRFERLGTKDIDLTPYIQKVDLIPMTREEILDICT